jgi:hypothetical protein
VKHASKSLLFVNKKKQKNFIHNPMIITGPGANGKSFFASFCSQKEVLPGLTP